MYNKRSITLKIFVSETESVFIKSCLQNINSNIKSEKNLSFKSAKEKSLSEFLREIILNNLLNINNGSTDKNLNLKLNQIEKIIKRNLSLTFENFKKQFGYDEANEVFLRIKEGEGVNR